MKSKRGLFSARAFSNAAGPHGNQSTGLWACWSKYGLVSWMRRLVCCSLMLNLSAPQSLSAVPAACVLLQKGRGSYLVHCRVAFCWYLLFPLPPGEGVYVFTNTIPSSREL